MDAFVGVTFVGDNLENRSGLHLQMIQETQFQLIETNGTELNDIPPRS